MRKNYIFLIAITCLFYFSNYAQVYYYKGTGNLHAVASWGANTDGSGAAPANFTSAGQTFHLVNCTSATLTANWTVSGTGTYLNIGDGITGVNLIDPSSRVLSIGTGAFCRVTDASTLTLQHTTFPAAARMTLNSGSTVVFDQASPVSLWALATYHNLTISGGANKTQTGNMTIAGDLNLTNSLTMSNSTSITLTLNGTVSGSGLFLTGNSRITIGGTGALGTMTFGTGNTVRTINRFTINRTSSGSVTLGSDLTVSSNYTHSNGAVDLNGNLLAFTSAISVPTSTVNGYITGSTTSSISISGSGSITNSLLMDPSSNASQSLSSLTMSRASTTLTIGNSLRIIDVITPTTGGINSGGNITLVSTATTKARVGVVGTSGSLNGNINVQLFTSAGTTGYNTLGSPGLNGLTFSEWDDNIAITCPTCPDGDGTSSGNPFTSVFSYDETVGGVYDNALRYVNIADITDAMTLGKGYWVYLGDNYPSTGSIVLDATGTAATKTLTGIPLTLTGAADSDHGWNFVANPYPSPISFAQFRSLQTSNITNALYVYNPDLNSGAGDFATYVGGVSSPAIGAGGVDDNIPMGQGFYLQVTATCTVIPIESWKSSTVNDLLKTTTTVATQAQDVFRLNLTGGGNNSNTETVFHFNTNATNAYDQEYDGRYIYDVYNPNAKIYSMLNGEMYRINGLANLTSNVSIPVMVEGGTNSNNTTFTITPVDINDLPAGACVNLYDNHTNTTHDLRTGPYIFTYSDTTTVARFALNITISTATLTSNFTNPTCNSSQNGKIIASGTTTGPWNYTWKDESGQVIVQNTLSTADTLDGLNAGIYHLDINTVGTCDNASATFNIAPTVAPVASFTTDADTTYLNTGASIVFTNTSTNTDNYTWYFGDGQFGNSANTTHTYDTIGVYEVQLVAVNSACGDSSIYSKLVYVNLQNLTTAITNNEKSTQSIIISKDNGGVFVKFNYPTTTKAIINVHNILGQQLITPISNHVANDKIYLNVSDIKNQVILISVTTDDARLTNRVFTN